MKTNEKLGTLVLSIIAGYVGLKFIFTGVGGHRNGFAHGMHLRIVGVVLVVFGIYGFVQWLRDDKNRRDG